MVVKSAEFGRNVANLINPRPKLGISDRQKTAQSHRITLCATTCTPRLETKPLLDRNYKRSRNSLLKINHFAAMRGRQFAVPESDLPNQLVRQLVDKSAICQIPRLIGDLLPPQ